MKFLYSIFNCCSPDKTSQEIQIPDHIQNHKCLGFSDYTPPQSKQNNLVEHHTLHFLQKLFSPELEEKHTSPPILLNVEPLQVSKINSANKMPPIQSTQKHILLDTFQIKQKKQIEPESQVPLNIRYDHLIPNPEQQYSLRSKNNLYEGQNKIDPKPDTHSSIPNFQYSFENLNNPNEWTLKTLQNKTPLQKVKIKTLDLKDILNLENVKAVKYIEEINSKRFETPRWQTEEKNIHSEKLPIPTYGQNNENLKLFSEPSVNQDPSPISKDKSNRENNQYDVSYDINNDISADRISDINPMLEPSNNNLT
jgi:hypothetical protein